MDKEQLKIKDALTIEYLDFIEYCSSIEKEFVSEISTVDYIAFRTQFGVSKEYITKIKNAISDFVAHLEQDHFEDTSSQGNQSSIEAQKKETQVIIEKQFEIVTEKKPQEQKDEDTSNTSELETSIINDVQANETECSPTQIKEIVFDSNDESFSSLLGIDASYYRSISIDASSMSIRSKNALKRAYINTVEDLLNKSESEIRKIRNLGAISIKEILEFIQQIVQDSVDDNGIENEDFQSVCSNVKAVKDTLLFLLGEDNQCPEDLSDCDKKAVDQYMESIEVIGEELAVSLLKEPSKIIYLQYAFNNFIQETRIEEEIKELIPHVFLHEKKNNQIGPCVKAYYAFSNDMIPYELFDESVCFDEFASFATRIILNSDMPKSVRQIYNNFLQWLGTDIKTQIDKTLLSAFNDERLSDVLKARAQGEALVQIGERLNLTRERIRQIEQRGIKRFQSSLASKKNDFILHLFALNNGELITKETFNKYIPSEYAEMLWAFVCAGYFNSTKYSYSEVYDSIVASCDNKDGTEQSQTVAMNFPDMISIQEMENLICEAVQKQRVSEEKLRIDVDSLFIKYKTFYSRKKLSKQDITNLILKNRFRNGFKIADETYYNKFISYVKEDVTDTDLNYTQRGLDSKIPIKGVLCDRGTYLHTDYFEVPTDVLTGINSYIENSSKNVLTYGEIYDDNQGLFIGTVIVNKYCLQGALKKYGSEYTLRKDYLTKDASMSFLDEFENFVKESGTVHKSEIYSMFPTLDDLSLGNIMGRSQNVISIDNGYYIHSSQLNLLSEDYVVIRTILNKAVENLPINSRTVFDIFSSEYSDFLSRNNISDKSELFGILQYMFGKEYTFSRPYIAKVDVDSVTNQSMLLSILEDFDSIQTEDLLDIIKEHNLSCRSLSYFAPLISPTFMLIDDDTFMRAESAGITEEVIEAVCEIVDEHMNCNDYFLTLDVDDFLWYPSINIEWTAKLLDSIIIASGKYDYIPLQSNRQGRNSLIVISEKYKDMQYQDFVLAQVEEAFDKGFFSDKNEMKIWLIEKHFIEKGLPNFLESDSFFYIDEVGCMRKK